MLVQLMVSKSYIWASFVEIQCNFLICNKILLKQIQNVRVVQSFDLETPALRMAHSIRVVLFIFIWIWNPPCRAASKGLLFIKIPKYWISTTLLLWKPNGDNWNSNKALWQCWSQVQSKQWRTVGLTVLQKTSIIQQLSVELTSCPSS